MIHSQLVRFYPAVCASVSIGRFHLRPLLRCKVGNISIALLCLSCIIPCSYCVSIRCTVDTAGNQFPVTSSLIVITKILFESLLILLFPSFLSSLNRFSIGTIIVSHIFQSLITVLFVIELLSNQSGVTVFQVIFAVTLAMAILAFIAMTIATFMELRERLDFSALTAHFHTGIVPHGVCICQ